MSTRKQFHSMQLTEPWHRLPGEVVEPPFWRSSKADYQLDHQLSGGLA